jgi:hypothetical protein
MDASPVAFIPLQNGLETVVDLSDYQALKDYSWQYDAGYARAWIKSTRRRLHCVLLNVPEGFVRDHKNHNTLDNRRSNIRAATHQQNSSNQMMTAKNKSGYKGVCKAKRSKKWVAQIRHAGVNNYLGRYDTKEQAYAAYCAAAAVLHGEFAHV